MEVNKEWHYGVGGICEKRHQLWNIFWKKKHTLISKVLIYSIHRDTHTHIYISARGYSIIHKLTSPSVKNFLSEYNKKLSFQNEQLKFYFYYFDNSEPVFIHSNSWSVNNWIFVMKTHAHETLSILPPTLICKPHWGRWFLPLKFLSVWSWDNVNATEWILALALQQWDLMSSKWPKLETSMVLNKDQMFSILRRGSRFLFSFVWIGIGIWYEGTVVETDNYLHFVFLPGGRICPSLGKKLSWDWKYSLRREQRRQSWDV